MLRKQTSHRLCATLAMALAVAGCAPMPAAQVDPADTTAMAPQGQPARAAGNPSVFPPGSEAMGPTDPEKLLPPAGGELIGNNAGGFISNNSSGVVSEAAAALVGQVKLPSTFIANNSGSFVANNSGSFIANNSGSFVANNSAGFISNNSAGYQVLATSEEVPVEGLWVVLRRADGTLVRDALGNPYVARTDASGKYALTYQGSMNNVLTHVVLPDQLGELLGYVDKGISSAPRQADLNLASTLAMTYTLTEYVQGEQLILDRMTATLEQETRNLLASKEVTYTDLTAPETRAAVQDLRGTDGTVDAQMEKVKRQLIIGLPNQGEGLPADTVETDAFSSVAVSPFGEVFFIGRGTSSVWKKGLDGKLYRLAGTGSTVDTSVTGSSLGASEPAPGDGGPANEASLWPTFMAFHKTGVLYVSDEAHRRVRKIDENGVITTFAAHDGFRQTRELVFEPDGSMLLATHCAIYRISKDGQTITRISGTADRPINHLLSDQSDGTLAGARYVDITGLAVDPARGDLFVYDYNGRVRKFAKASGYAETTPIPARTLGGPLGNAGALAVDASGSLIIADSFNTVIRKLPAHGTAADLTTIAGVQSALGVSDPGPLVGLVRSLSIHETGEIFFSDTGLVRRLAGSAAGPITTVVGRIERSPASTPADQVQFSYPGRLLYEPQTNSMLIGDSFRLRRWNLGTDMVDWVSSSGPFGDPLSSDPLTSSLFLFGAMAQVPVDPTNPTAGVQTLYHAVDHTGKHRLLSHVNTLAGPAISTIAGGLGQPQQWDGNDMSYWGTVDATTGLKYGDAVGAPLSAYHLYYDLAATTDGLFTTLMSNVGAAGAKGALFKLVPSNPADPSSPLRMYHLLGPIETPMSALAVRTEGADRYLYVGYYGGISKVKLVNGFPEVTLDPTTGQPVPVIQPVTGLSLSQLQDPANMALATFQLPGQIIFDGTGRLLFSDPHTNRVLRVDGAALTTVAGPGSTNFGGDNVDNGLAAPHGIAFDALGNLYIASQEHHQIKKVEAAKL